MSSASSWSDLQVLSTSQAVGKSLNDEVKLRQSSHGSAHVKSTLRLFDANNDEMPKLTLYRDDCWLVSLLPENHVIDRRKESTHQHWVSTHAELRG